MPFQCAKSNQMSLNVNPGSWCHNPAPLMFAIHLDGLAKYYLVCIEEVEGLRETFICTI